MYFLLRCGFGGTFYFARSQVTFYSALVCKISRCHDLSSTRSQVVFSTLHCGTSDFFRSSLVMSKSSARYSSALLVLVMPGSSVHHISGLRLHVIQFLFQGLGLHLSISYFLHKWCREPSGFCQCWILVLDYRKKVMNSCKSLYSVLVVNQSKKDYNNQYCRQNIGGLLHKKENTGRKVCTLQMLMPMVKHLGQMWLQWHLLGVLH